MQPDRLVNLWSGDLGGPAVSVGDLDGDGRDDIAVSDFGRAPPDEPGTPLGAVRIYAEPDGPAIYTT